MNNKLGSIFLKDIIYPIIMILALFFTICGQVSNNKPLPFGKSIERQIKVNEVHSYLLKLKQNSVLHLEVLEKGVDLTVLLFDESSENALAEVDFREGNERERMTFVADKTGNFIVKVKSSTEAESGFYQISAKINSTATAADRQRQQSEKLLAESANLLVKGESESDFRKSIEKAEQALQLFQGLDDKDFEGFSYAALGAINNRLGENEKSIELLQKSISLFKTVNDKDAELFVLAFIAKIYADSGETQKAIDALNESLAHARSTKNKTMESFVVNAIGTLYLTLGENQKALEWLNQYLQLERSLKDKSGEASALNNLALFYENTGDIRRALDYYQQALEVEKTYGNQIVKATILSNMGVIYHRQGEVQKALENFQQSLVIRKAIYDRDGEAFSLQNIGDIYGSLGETQKALEYYEQALKIFQSVGNKIQEVEILNSIGNSYFSLAAYYAELNDITKLREYKSKAVSNYRQALELNRKFGNRSGEAYNLSNLAFIYFITNSKKEALEYNQQALDIFKSIGEKKGEADALDNIGEIYAESDEYQKALDHYQQALIIRKAIKDIDGEIDTYVNLMSLWKNTGNSSLAAFYGKQSINKVQEVRLNIQDFEKESQKKFLKGFEYIYRNLADILISIGRIVEAEQVLAMLKEEETLSYLRRDDKVARDLLQTVSLTGKEREALKRYDELADKITAAGKEFGELDAERKNYDEGQFPKQARYDELKKQLADATTTFQKFLEDLKIAFGQKDERVVSVDSSLQNTLKRLKANRTAIVSIIVGENRLNIIVTTADTQRAHTIDISEKDINSLVADFRQALTHPKIDPRPSGQKLYDVLVKPIEADLAGIEADTILWSLDGTLRYIPTAALWDKQKGYLAERFASAVLTLASRDTLALPVSDKRNWSALGVGVSKPTEGFSALTAVPDELDCIITDAAAKTVSLKPVCQNGVMTGKKLLDDKFTLPAFENSLGRFPIIHIASHFSLNPGNDKDSFLLLGGGEQKRFTVENLRGISLTDVELIVLSACNTATPGGEKANGVEIEGFGAVAQKQGAKAVMATLWSVADDSTRDLMVNFYGLYDKNNLTKAEAIRQAQLTMIYGKYKPSDGNTKRGAEIVNLGGDNKPQIPFKTDDNAPSSHPFYWSPFVLYGNWR